MITFLSDGKEVIEITSENFSDNVFYMEGDSLKSTVGSIGGPAWLVEAENEPEAMKMAQALNDCGRMPTFDKEKATGYKMIRLEVDSVPGRKFPLYRQ